jgi:hypothetical protein
MNNVLLRLENLEKQENVKKLESRVEKNEVKEYIKLEEINNAFKNVEERFQLV